MLKDIGNMHHSLVDVPLKQFQHVGFLKELFLGEES
jgi:hypothetical protein